MNKLLEYIYQARKGHYCHVLELHYLNEYKEVIEALYEEFIKRFSLEDIIDFFNTISIYALNEKEESSLYNFNPEKYIIKLHGNSKNP